jgi:signal transduction histidine kinase/ActR/RegA family two-component response regulator
MKLSSPKAIKILLINDSELESEAVLHALKLLEFPLEVEHISTAADLLERLEQQDWSLVISAFQTKELLAKDALSIIKNTDLPFILISNGIGDEEVASMMKAGVEDIVMSSRMERIVPVVRRVLREREAKEKELKARRMATHAFAVKEQMLAIVSHDIKNPLCAIQLEAQMLIKNAERTTKVLSPEEVKIQAKRILKTTDKLKSLIVDLLERNKSVDGLASLTKQSLDPAKLFHEVIDSCRLLMKEKNIILRTAIPYKSGKIPLDKNKMFQVLSNLLNNAIKFTPEGGEIELTMEEQEYDILFSVKDNGPGLKQEDLNRVFEKYWTGDISGCSGTGLGLFICKSIVDAHEGQILVENTEKGGARFWFSLPKPYQEKSADYWIKDNKRKILVIDDDHDLRELICWALGQEGFSVHAYSNAQDALESLQRGRHSPQLIVVDYHMDGMNGSEFVRRKSLTSSEEIKNCPVVMISASPEDVQLDNASTLCREILPKPLDLEALLLNIRKYINEEKALTSQ